MIIGFDTATSATAVAAVRDGNTLFSASDGPSEDGRPRHAALLLPLIERAVDAGGGWSSVDRIAVGVGPGTFTGIRIGVVTAKALSVAHGRELVGVETTHALGSRAAAQTGQDVCAVIDGKRGEVFACRVNRTGTLAWGAVVAAPQELAARLAEEGFEGPLVGDAVELYGDELLGGGRYRPDPALDLIDAAEICRLGAEGESVGRASLEPRYLRRPDAERWIERDA